MLFRRRARPVSSTSQPGAHAGRGCSQPQEPGAGPLVGGYLTDGRSLFLVQHAITEIDGLQLDEALLELEDCKTLELILCSASALERLGLRPVTPSSVPAPGQSALVAR